MNNPTHARLPDEPAPSSLVIEPWERRQAWDVSFDSGPAYDKREIILSAANRATGCFRGVTPRLGTLVPYAILLSPDWWIKVTSQRLVYFDAWNGSDRYMFWMNASSVKDLLARIDLEIIT